MISRRSLITGLIAFGVTAPAIVRAASLMPVKAMKPILPDYFIWGPMSWGPMHPDPWATVNGLPIYRNGKQIVAGDLIPGQVVSIVLNCDRWVMV